jgi:hypothetical protein
VGDDSSERGKGGSTLAASVTTRVCCDEQGNSDDGEGYGNGDDRQNVEEVPYIFKRPQNNETSNSSFTHLLITQSKMHTCGILTILNSSRGHDALAMLLLFAPQWESGDLLVVEKLNAKKVVFADLAG